MRKETKDFINGVLSRISAFISKTFREPDGTPSSKRILYGLVVVYTLGLVTGVMEANGMKLDPQVVDLLKTLIYATGGTYAASRFAEKPPEGGAV